jgi:HAD superfamily hydrolase (TIGR01490 family)
VVDPALASAIAPAAAVLTAQPAPRAAAFFDVDRTLIRRSSTLALAPALRRHGLIGRVALLRSALGQLVYVVRGVTAQELDRMADRGFGMMEGWSEAAVAGVVTAELEMLGALAFPDVLGIVARERANGRAAIAISASLATVVAPLAERLGLDAAIGSVAETRRGRFTGRSTFFCHGENKARALHALADAAGLDLAACSAYTDSVTDCALLEAVGEPHAVNPDRRLRRAAIRRGWPVVEVA